MLRRALPAAFAAFLGTAFAATALGALPCSEPGAESPQDLRESLRRSTVAAIELEIDAYAAKLKASEGGTGSEENTTKFRRRIAELEAERDRFDRMPSGEYPEPSASAPDAGSVLDEATADGPILPARMREAILVAAGPYGLGDLLEVEGTSRSGPFFHLAGIIGGDASILKRGTRYRLVMYLVYRREYFGLIGDYYVYLGSVRE